MVYHYTTIDTLYNILASYKASEDKDNLIFWASNILNQNDEKEMSLKYEDIQDILNDVEDKLEKEGIVNYTNKLSRLIQQSLLFNTDPNEVQKSINGYNEEKYTPYTISFSRQKDKLIMWSIYANNGNGICLCFDEKKIKVEAPEMYYIYDNVVYTLEKKHLFDLIELAYRQYLEIVKDHKLLNGIWPEKYLTTKALLTMLSPFFKNRAFNDEKEWRIVLFKRSDFSNKIYTRLSRRMHVISYIKIGISLSSLKKVIIGPCADYDNTRELLMKVSSDCGIKKMASSDFYVKSNVPYRDF